MDRTNEAIDLFKKRYGRTPKELGFPVISVYKKQEAFLYASSEDVIKAYKVQQDIIRWMLCWFLLPMAVAFLVWLIAGVGSRDFGNPLCMAFYIFCGVWIVLLIILGIRVKLADKIVKIGRNITYLNY